MMMLKHSVLLLSLLINLSSGLFFGPGRSSCRSNRDCPRLLSSSGLCRQTSNGLCDLANLFRRNKENCGYRTCANCVNDVDCSGSSYCSGFTCISRVDRSYNNYNNYNNYNSGYRPPPSSSSSSGGSSGGIPSSWLRG